jgi:methionyl-tRNA synthetase
MATRTKKKTSKKKKAKRAAAAGRTRASKTVLKKKKTAKTVRTSASKKPRTAAKKATKKLAKKAAKTAPKTAKTPSRAAKAPRATASPKKSVAPDRTAAAITALKPAKPKGVASKRPPTNETLQRQAPKPRSKSGYYITTAIAYPNGVPHIGYGYEIITTDAIARFKRLDGHDVFFLTGTDEHGIKMVQTAAKEGVAPKQLVDQNVERFQAMAKLLDCSNDQFIRTTEERHHKASQAIWERMKANGDIYLSKYAGWYSVRDEAYYDESETHLDQTDTRLGPQGTPVEWVEEESYFFRLSAYQDRLLKLYADVPDFVLPKERLNEVASFVRGGLNDLSVSRTTFDWGVKVPGDPKHVMYVWVDALTNYITALGYPDVASDMFKRYWPADLHVIGKDIVRFHAVYWPAFLMSAGIELPRQIFCHGWILNRGEKMSKSVGNVADPFALAEAYGVDPLRYFFLREVSFGQDGNYSHEAIVNRINADLSNNLGNLAQRSLSMIAKQFGGAVPTPGEFTYDDKTVLAAADRMIEEARQAMKTLQLHQVLSHIWTVVAHANVYFTEQAPWALAKTDPARQGTVLYVTAEIIRQVAILIQPFVPTSAAKFLDLLGIPDSQRTFAAVGQPDLGGGPRLAPGTVLGTIAPVFPRYVEPETAKA